MKLLICLYLLVAIKEAIDFKLTVLDEEGNRSEFPCVDYFVMVVISAFWPIWFWLWIGFRVSKFFRPSSSPTQYQMFAKEK